MRTFFKYFIDLLFCHPAISVGLVAMPFLSKPMRCKNSLSDSLFSASMNSLSLGFITVDYFHCPFYNNLGEEKRNNTGQPGMLVYNKTGKCDGEHLSH
jgi:hypothetical protein